MFLSCRRNEILKKPGCVGGLFNIYCAKKVNNFGFNQTAGWEPSLIVQPKTRFEIFPKRLNDVSTYLKQLYLIKAYGLDGVSSFLLKVT